MLRVRGSMKSKFWSANRRNSLHEGGDLEQTLSLGNFSDSLPDLQELNEVRIIEDDFLPSMPSNAAVLNDARRGEVPDSFTGKKYRLLNKCELTKVQDTAMFARTKTGKTVIIDNNSTFADLKFDVRSYKDICQEGDRVRILTVLALTGTLYRAINISFVHNGSVKLLPAIFLLYNDMPWADLITPISINYREETIGGQLNPEAENRRGQGIIARFDPSRNFNSSIIGYSPLQPVKNNAEVLIKKVARDHPYGNNSHHFFGMDRQTGNHVLISVLPDGPLATFNPSISIHQEIMHNTIVVCDYAPFPNWSNKVLPKWRTIKIHRIQPAVIDDRELIIPPELLSPDDLLCYKKNLVRRSNDLSLKKWFEIKVRRGLWYLRRTIPKYVRNPESPLHPKIRRWTIATPPIPDVRPRNREAQGQEVPDEIIPPHMMALRDRLNHGPEFAARFIYGPSTMHNPPPIILELSPRPENENDSGLED